MIAGQIQPANKALRQRSELNGFVNRHAAPAARRTPAPVESEIPYFQRALGNRRVGTLLHGLPTTAPAAVSRALAPEAQITVNTPADSPEREADAVTGRVHAPETVSPQGRREVTTQPRHVAGPAILSSRSGVLQRSRARNGIPLGEHECAPCRAKRQAELETLYRQGPKRASAVITTSGPTDVEVSPGVAVTRALSESGNPIEPRILAQMERAFGQDLSSVRVHTDSSAAASAEAVGADAYTVGRDIIFSAGAYAPDVQAGRLVLAHELVHYLQQGAPRAPVRFEGDIGSPHQPSEKEADAAAKLVASGCAVGICGSVRPGRVQRILTTEPAGGCGICYGQANLAGIAAHEAIQLEFELEHPLGLVEFPFSSPGDENGRLDLAVATPFGLQIGEIKPGNQRGYEDGLRDLAFYIAALEQTYPDTKVSLLEDAIAPTIMPDPLAIASGCPEQELYVALMAPGLYGYLCEPPFSMVRRSCPCRQPPTPPPVRVPQEQPAGERQPSRAKRAAEAAAATGVAAGAGYLIYRGVRMLPSLFPPLWGTIPANVAIP